MASTSHNRNPSSSASTAHPTKWDVFLSFRGIDTRDSFTDFLYHSLDSKGIKTFRDDPELRTGEVISDALLQAIRESKTYVVVFSENYASSPWCLKELVEILDCHQSLHRLVLPVFYYIKPSAVKYQTGSFSKAFQTHESHDTRYERDRLVKWRDALKQVGNFSGYDVCENMSQVHVINKIVDRALQEVSPMTLDVAKYQVGLDSRIEDINTLLSNVTAGVTRIGIYGMGGVGKTTLAKAVYNQKYSQFKGSCFLENVKETSETSRGIACLQQKLISDVLNCKNITIDSASQGIELIRARICSTKILLVIDDLDSRDQLDFLVGPFSLGSTIIITTRDEGLLNSIDVEAKYKVNELDNVEARQLFCRHAFEGEDKMPDTFSKLSKEILQYAGGLPLALKVCGSALLKKSEEGWRDFIDELRRVSVVNVEKMLLISFNALNTPKLKDMFLDIACFFIGYKPDKAVKIMETCYTSVNYNIDILKERCLLTVNDNGFVMHDLLLDMGRKIACNNSAYEFEKHSRLWIPEIIHKVLRENKGTEAIEGIIPSDYDPYRPFDPHSREIFREESLITSSKSNHFSAETFERMSKLRFLYLRHVNLTGSFEHAFKDLRWLCWVGCSLNYLPSDFMPHKLVFLALSCSNMRSLWKLNTVGTVFKNLKTLNMSSSWYLTAAPDFTRLPCLETLDLSNCRSLEEIPILAGCLLRLVFLNLGWCINLKTLPDNICNLRALESLNIDSCRNLRAIPLNFGNIESLAELNTHDVDICELPHSIGRLSKLVVLNLSSCVKLKTLPDTICNLRSLKILNIDRCTSLEALPTELGNLESLVELKAKSIFVSELPNSIGRLSKLVVLNLDTCPNLKTLPDTICNLRSLKILDISWSSSLEALPIELGNLESLVSLDAGGLPNISKLPDSIRHIGSLEDLSLRSCFNLLFIGELPSSLNAIILQGCTAVERLPNLSNMKQLKKLVLTNCSGLREIQGLQELTSIERLYMGGCNLSLLKSTFTKRFFQIYCGFGREIAIYAPSSVFPDWIRQSPDWISDTVFPERSQSRCAASLRLPSNQSHNFLAMILCSEFSIRGTVYHSVTTTTDRIFGSSEFKTYPFDDYKDFSSMIIVPRTFFSLTEDDSGVEFEERLDIDDPDKAYSELADILGIHILYKQEITIIDECTPSM